MGARRWRRCRGGVGARLTHSRCTSDELSDPADILINFAVTKFAVTKRRCT